jgi:hypothetical protein
MNMYLRAAVTSLGLIVGVHATAGVVDRSAEVAAYLQDIQTGTRGAVTDTAKKIVDADLGDERVAETLYRKLTADLPTLDDDNSVDMNYKKAMVMAIAATGVAGYEDKLKPICEGIKLSSMTKTNYCFTVVSEMEINRRVNLLVADDTYHRQGEDPRVGRIMTLLMSDDFYNKHLAAHRMNWWKILDVRLTDVMAEQLPTFIPLMTKKGEHEADSAMAGYIKLLGYSGNPKYIPVLEKIMKSKARDALRQRTRKAVRALQRIEKQTGKNRQRQEVIQTDPSDEA